MKPYSIDTFGLYSCLELFSITANPYLQHIIYTQTLCQSCFSRLSNLAHLSSIVFPSFIGIIVTKSCDFIENLALRYFCHCSIFSVVGSEDGANGSSKTLTPSIVGIPEILSRRIIAK